MTTHNTGNHAQNPAELSPGFQFSQTPTSTAPCIDPLNDLIAAFKVIQAEALQAHRMVSSRHRIEAFISKLNLFLSKVDVIGCGLYRDLWPDDDDDYQPYTAPNPPATGKTKAELTDDLNQAFDNLCAAVEFNRELGLTLEYLGFVIFDAEQMIVRAEQWLVASFPTQAARCDGFFSLQPLPARRQAFYKVLRQSTPTEPTTDNAKAATGFNINPPRRRTLADIMQEQAQQRGLEPIPLEPELLLKRIKDGGHSGQYLADAFISAYRPRVPFPHSLGELTRLDAEAFRLFHEILHIRHVPGWNDDDLYRIEQRINAICKGGVQ